MNIEVTTIAQCIKDYSYNLSTIDGSAMQQYQFHDARSHIQNNSASKDM